MAIFRDKAPLIKAATGVEPPAPPQPTQTPLGQALSSKLMPVPTYGEFSQAAGLATPPLSSTMGLSPQGKYGGFYTTSDLDKAIRGEALARNEELLDYASTLRGLAQKQRSQVQQAVAAGTDVTPYGAMPRAEARDYGARRTAELAQTEQLAGQVEATPMSQLAQAIATRKYQMNPALAAGMYGTEYDIEAQKALRDQYYFETGQGFGYEDYLSQEKQKEQDVADLISEAKTTQDPALLQQAFPYSREVQDLYYIQQASKPLQMNAGKLFSAAQVTPQQGYELVTQPVNINGTVTTFSQLADGAFADIESDNAENAFATADQLMASPETRMLGRLLATYVDAIVRATGKVGRGLYQYQQTSDILG